MPEPDITELDELTASKVSGVPNPANGTPWMLLKAAEASEMEGDESDEIESELTKASGMGFCGTEDCGICDDRFGPIAVLLKRKLKAADRRALPDSDYAIPEKAPGSGSYPINDENHARAALSMLHHASPDEQKRIKAAVHRKYPNIGSDDDAKKEDGPVEKSPGVPEESVATPTENGHVARTGQSGIAGPATAGPADPVSDASYHLGGQSTYEIPAEGRAFTVAAEPAPKPTELAGVSAKDSWTFTVTDAAEKGDWLSVDEALGLKSDPNAVVGGPAWEAFDAATLEGAARGLAAAARMVTEIGKREATEAINGNASEWLDTYQLGCALDDINHALCLVAGLACHEAAAEKGAEKADMHMLRAARDHLTSVLGAGAHPAGPGPGTESESIMAEVTKEELHAFITEAATKAALDAVAADREARKNANNGGDIDEAGLNAGVRGTADADDVNAVGPGSPDPGVTKSEDPAIKALTDQVAAMSELLEKVAGHPRGGGPVLDGVARGAVPASEGRMGEQAAKSAEDLRIEELTKNFEESLKKSGPEAAYRADEAGYELTLAKLRQAHLTGRI